MCKELITVQCELSQVEPRASSTGHGACGTCQHGETEMREWVGCTIDRRGILLVCTCRKSAFNLSQFSPVITVYAGKQLDVGRGRISVFKAGPVVQLDGLDRSSQCHINVVAVSGICHWCTPVGVEMQAGSESVNQTGKSCSVAVGNGVGLSLSGE